MKNLKGGENIEKTNHTPKTRKIITITLLTLALILTLGTVAADPGTLYVNNATGNDSWNGQSATYNITTGDGPKQSIKNATDSVENNGIINIADGLFTGENNTAILISKNMTIIGQSQTGTVIDAQLAQIFLIQSDTTVTIKNLTLLNGSSEYGGSISNAGNLNLENIAIYNSTADSAGALWNDGIVNILNSLFQQNTADGRSYGGYGGAIYNNGVMHIFSSIFLSNNALIWGGAIINGGNLTISDTNFTDNNGTYTWYNVGGAIYNFANLNITGCNFTQNNAINGGAIAHQGDSDGLSHLEVYSSTFTENNADEGGAFYIYDGDFKHNIIEFNRILSNTATTGSAISIPYGTVNATMNWWGQNNPDFTGLFSGNGIDYSTWLFMTLSADPSIINNTQTTQIIASFNNYSSDGITSTAFAPLPNRHLPNNTQVNFQTDLGSLDCKNVDKNTYMGTAIATLTADELAGTAHLNSTLDEQTLYLDLTINPTSNLYLNITPSNTNPVPGDTVIYKLKVGNYGPDSAENVVMTYTIPEGLVFAGASDDVGGKWIYDANTRTITWTLGTVPVGDPTLLLTLYIAQAGNFLINPLLSTTTFDPNLNLNTQSLTVNAATPTSTEVNAATSNTIGMQTTGAPLAPLAIGILSILGAIAATRRK